MKIIKSARNRAGVVGELFGFLWRRKLWWITPMALVLILFGVVIIFAQSTPLGAFIYSLL